MKKDKKRLVKEYTKAIITALIVAFLIRTFVVQAFKIPSGSMIPTLLIGDHILVNKFIYGIKVPFTDKKILTFRKPQRGDIIVFKYPEDPKKDFIKRVIAIEGDTIELKDKTVYVNRKATIEPYVNYTDSYTIPAGSSPRDNLRPLIVPKDSVFVMGDNRDQSYDSRYWGFVNVKDIKGKAFIIYWSWDSKKWLRINRIGKLVK